MIDASVLLTLSAAPATPATDATTPDATATAAAGAMFATLLLAAQVPPTVPVPVPEASEMTTTAPTAIALDVAPSAVSEREADIAVDVDTPAESTVPVLPARRTDPIVPTVVEHAIAHDVITVAASAVVPVVVPPERQPERPPAPDAPFALVPVVAPRAEVATATPITTVHVAHPAPAAHPAQQVVRALMPLRRAADGTYELQLELRPDGLGELRLDVAVRESVVHVSMRAETEQARAVLARSLPELRAGLTDAGLQPGQLGVAVTADEHRRNRSTVPFTDRGTEPSGRGRRDERARPRPTDRRVDDRVDLFL